MDSYFHPVDIVEAVPDDHEILSELTKLSKASWGYSSELMNSWDVELTITREYIQTKNVFRLMDGKQLAGYFSWYPLKNKSVMLENLFLHPEYIGKGWGKFVMDHLTEKWKEAGIKSVELESDPHAESFYLKYGFTITGRKKSVVPGRIYPIMQKEL